MRRTPVIVLMLVIGGSLAGCVSGSSSPADDTPPWKEGASAEVITAAPDAGGPLSFRNCPTLTEAKGRGARLDQWARCQRGPLQDDGVAVRLCHG